MADAASVPSASLLRTCALMACRQLLKIAITKRTSTHIPAFYSLMKWGFAIQCSCARRFEQFAHDLLSIILKAQRMHYQLARAKRREKVGH